MKFFVGDKILFKNENLKGKVIRIDSPYKMTILSENGFEMKVSKDDVVKIERGTDKPIAYGKNFDSKDSDVKIAISQKQQKPQSILKVDLHIESLHSNYQYMDSFEIIQIQLDECHKKIKKALTSKITKLEIIHGIGQGVLKDQVHDLLRNYSLRFYLTKDGGATEVYL